MSADERQLAFPHSAQHVAAVLDALAEQLDGRERQYVRARDLQLDEPNQTVGSVLSIVADHPGAISEVYGLAVEIDVARHAQQPAGTVWEVRRA